MKKTLLVPFLVVLTGGALAAGCASVISSSSTPVVGESALAKEVASSSLFVSSIGAASLKRAATSEPPFTGTPITIDPNDIGTTLASFDELSIADYKITTIDEVSDRANYANKTQLTYTLPSGEGTSITLYFGAIATSSESGTDSSEASSSQLPTPDTNGSLQDALHGHGYGAGNCDGMLNGANRFVNILKHGNADVTYERRFGAAIMGEAEYPFAAEHLTAVTSNKTYEASSFALRLSSRSFLSVEQAYVTDGTNLNEVYVYTILKGEDTVHFVIQDTPTKMRMSYMTPTQKVAINRFEEGEKTYYTIHLRQKGIMNLNGVYEKVIVVDESGNTTVTYQPVESQEESSITIPSEN